MAAIETSGLSKRYRRTWALSEVDLVVEAGGITALVGPNGAGKSTLLKLCVGFERPTRGGLRIWGIDPTRDRAGAVRSVGYVPQDPALYRELTVEEHLRFAGSLRPGFDAAHARSRLRQLQIPLAAPATDLSGGQQAQVSLAIALGTRAPVLLLDEPLANLDPLARREFLTVLGEAVRADGVTAVLASHVVAEVEPVCDRLLVLGFGRVLLHVTVAEALGGHRVAPDGTVDAPGLVALFPDRAGAFHALVRNAASVDVAATRPATMEEIVMGYLSAGRADPSTVGRLDAGAALAVAS
ncbi:MAG TPA: ABC transporter ATP-binding protein [Candidatus Limnocylindrales bacterium]|nr:ABC transporter ATP-binding protein [Candidatus Limnocylindrales bacterium]